MAGKDSILIKIGADAGGLKKGLSEGQQALKSFEGGVQDSMGKLLQLAGILGVGLGFAHLAAEALEFADAVTRVHDQTSLSTDAIQRLNFIATQTGGSMEQLAGAVSKMQRTLSDAGDDGDKARKAVSDLGLDISALMAMSPDQQFQKIAEAINAIPNPADQAAAAVDIFGKAGAEALPQIKAMAEHGEELSAQFDAIGGPAGGAAIAAVDALGDSAAATGLAAKTLAVELLATVAPAIISGLTTIQEILGGIRVLAGDGANEIVNLDRQIDGMTDSLKAFKDNNPFPDAFGKQRIEEMETAIAKLKETEQTLAGLGTVQTQLIPKMEEFGTVILDMTDALNLKIETGELTHQQVLQQIRDDAGIAQLASQMALHDEVQKDLQTHADVVGDIVGVDMSKREQFTNMSYTGQVETVAGKLTQITAGVAQHNKKLFEINKAAGIASAVIATAKGVAGVLGDYPGPVGWALAAVQLAAGIVQINAIKSATYQGGGAGSPPSSAGSQVPTPTTPAGDGGGGGQGQVLRLEGIDPNSIFSGTMVRSLAEKLAEHAKDGGTVIFQ